MVISFYLGCTQNNEQVEQTPGFLSQIWEG
jgi:hypothetical protein